MSKKGIYAIAVSALLFTGYSAYHAQNKQELSDILLANIDALTVGESFTFDGVNWDDDHHWYNHIGSKWKPEKKECTYHSGSYNVGVSVGVGNTGVSGGYTSSSYSQPGHKVDCVEGDGNCVNGTSCIPD